MKSFIRIYSFHIGVFSIVIGFYCIIMMSCRKFIEVDAPATSTNADIVFSDNGLAASVMTGVYAKLGSGFTTAGGAFCTLSLFPELASDNFSLASSIVLRYMPYYKNDVSPLYTDLAGNYWTEFYGLIYTCNAVIENTTVSNKLSEGVEKQLAGEAYFMRALMYFYLVNMFGDVPMVTTIDYKKSDGTSRVDAFKIYELIIEDLKKAIDLLNDHYMDATLTKVVADRVRPNKFAAMSLLSRVYLYTGNYSDAEKEASAVIANKLIYDTIPSTQTFQKNNNTEIIWALQPVRAGENTWEAMLFILPAAGPSATRQIYLSSQLMSSFESSDARLANWVQKRTASNGIVYPYAAKYRINTLNAPLTEYSVVLRLAEQYLIRAEARTQLNRIQDAKEDLNVIRRRARLANTTASNKTELLNAIFKERQVEFFAEYGHRWFDLRRTGKIDIIMEKATSLKGGVWKPEMRFFPIPQLERERNANLSQNDGYPQ